MPLAWKFIRPDRLHCHGSGARWVDGEWCEVSGPLVACKRGLHASVRALDALGYASDERSLLARVEYEGDTVSECDKVAARRMRVLWTADCAPALLPLAFRWAERARQSALAGLPAGPQRDALAACEPIVDAVTAKKAESAEYAEAAEAAAWVAEAAGAAAWAAESAEAARWGAKAAGRAAGRAAEAARWAAKAAGWAAWWAAEAARWGAKAAGWAAWWAAGWAAEREVQAGEVEAAFLSLEVNRA